MGCKETEHREQTLELQCAFPVISGVSPLSHSPRKEGTGRGRVFTAWAAWLQAPRYSKHTGGGGRQRQRHKGARIQDADRRISSDDGLPHAQKTFMRPLLQCQATTPLPPPGYRTVKHALLFFSFFYSFQSGRSRWFRYCVVTHCNCNRNDSNRMAGAWPHERGASAAAVTVAVAVAARRLTVGVV